MPTAIGARMIETYTGRFVDPLDPDPAALCIEDIAHALANICRFNGHTARHYSVAEHSIYVAAVLRRWGCGEWTILHGLMHDAAEAYLCDLVSPLKHDLFGNRYVIAEGKLMQRIADRFGFSASFADPEGLTQIATADELLLWCEAAELLKSGGRTWAGYGERVMQMLHDEGADVRWMIRDGWALKAAQGLEGLFLDSFRVYGGVR